MIKRGLHSIGCGSVGRVVASNTWSLQFESSHWQNLYRTFLYCQLYWKNEKIKKKRMGNFFKKRPPQCFVFHVKKTFHNSKKCSVSWKDNLFSLKCPSGKHSESECGQQKMNLHGASIKANLTFSNNRIIREKFSSKMRP